ncbi:hypothetical protein HPP92_006953 [Vanilla planifolia]|uniref:Uncharacterized protein n=1 Tax=Vanilla planifolia TaxID=51239 RepID=A0A835VAT0_VANPL|nr:hypothetical protein HPP92_007187 [Vanilla planifolia]KAG0490090.1 hypothetical protein HPP92_006953 [Vanilla planifolia]
MISARSRNAKVGCWYTSTKNVLCISKSTEDPLKVPAIAFSSPLKGRGHLPNFHAGFGPDRGTTRDSRQKATESVGLWFPRSDYRGGNELASKSF